MEKQYIRQLNDKDNVESYFMVKDKTLGVGKNGKAFMSVLLGDKTGSLDGRLWDRVDEVNKEFEVGDILKVKGAVQVFQGRKQIVIHKVERVIVGDKDVPAIEEFIVVSNKNLDDLWANLMLIVSEVKNDFVRQLLKDTLEDPEIKPKFMTSPAARSIHHAWRGGLLEHVISICKLMQMMKTVYPFLNLDFLIFGAIYHDLGKIYELNTDQGVQYTDRGRLIGHIGIGCELIDKKSMRVMGFTEELRDMLKHIVLSHHGRLEYGSPKRPKFMEAMVVAMIDELDSKITTVQTFVEEERMSGARWSRYNDLFDRYFLLDDLNEKY